MKEYINPEIEIMILESSDILTFSLGELEDMIDGTETPKEGLGGGKWGW